MFQGSLVMLAGNKGERGVGQESAKGGSGRGRVKAKVKRS